MALCMNKPDGVMPPNTAVHTPVQAKQATRCSGCHTQPGAQWRCSQPVRDSTARQLHDGDGDPRGESLTHGCRRTAVRFSPMYPTTRQTNDTVAYAGRTRAQYLHRTTVPW